MRRVVAPLVVVLAGLVLGGLLAEIGARVFWAKQSEELLPLSYSHDDLRRIEMGDAYIRFDADLGWSPRPAVRREGDGVTYQTNSAGMRAEREYALQPPAGARRLAAFGDSFTHCDEVGYADCWTAELERAWPGTEVLNFGMPASAPDQAWLRYRRDGRPYRPCAVLIGYFVENINRVVNRFRPFYSPETGIVLSKPRFVLDGDGLALLQNPASRPDQLDDPRWVEQVLGPSDYWYFPGTFVANPFDFLEAVRLARTDAYRRLRRSSLRGDERYPLYREEEPYQVAGRVLVQFAREVQGDGATPVVLMFGGRRDLGDVASRGGEKLYAPLLDWLAREGIPALDVGERLIRDAPRGGFDSLFTSEGHYRGSANRIVAATLARQLPGLASATCGG
ncbi:MAG TPA: hypothetical protein VEQ11_07365 [Chloroflexota bacterium]|nr:hypothetical protein [Chloroflexota bacterium]